MTTPDKTWLVWQLADSAFPAGGFAHSGGLEASFQLGLVERFEAYLDPSLWQVGHVALPFVRAAARRPNRLGELDALADATLTNHIANRASRAQGRAFWSTARRVFDAEALRQLGARASATMHVAPIFGAALAALGMNEDDAVSLYMHTSIRTVLSAAVRLGIVGPLEAQRLQSSRGPLLGRIVASCAAIAPDEIAQTFPLSDACAALHDGLYARLFQS
ncbi:urease accessory protein UreF [Pendulispora albinea]|uniref:Urease accessory protein UreF n=1 Tax=Pendulispora albinea TaxID=2741071 RepID=A0ABZ2LPI4_9BACT